MKHMVLLSVASLICTIVLTVVVLLIVLETKVTSTIWALSLQEVCVIALWLASIVVDIYVLRRVSQPITEPSRKRELRRIDRTSARNAKRLLADH